MKYRLYLLVVIVFAISILLVFKNSLLNNKNTKLQERAAFALGEIGDNRALDALDEAQLHQDKDISKTAIEAIEKQVQSHIATVGQTVPFMMDKLYEQASRCGVDTVLSGFGGDEGVTSHASGIFEELVCRREWKYLKEQLRRKVDLRGGNYKRSLIKYYLFVNYRY